MIATIVLSLVLLAVVALIIRSLINRRKNAKDNALCGGSCASCGCCPSARGIAAAESAKK